MCGIFAYAGKNNASQIVFEGLKRLDYRGYDSYGIGVLKNNLLKIQKKAGNIEEAVLNLPNTHLAIGHTRWATHGEVNNVNAHPHFSTDRAFCLAQNGIVENYESLKNKLTQKGYKFISQTDTEVIVRLIEDELKAKKDLKSAVRSAFLQLSGRNTIIVLSRNKEIIACRYGSPLVIGKNRFLSECYFSSDVLSLAKNCSQVLVLDNGQMAIFAENKLTISDIKTKGDVKNTFSNITISSSKIDKEGYPHFMLKEINEAPLVIARLINQNKKDYQKLSDNLAKFASLYCLGSGTAAIAAAQIAFYLRKIAKINATALIGAEASEYCDLFTRNDLLITPSQSGETADVLEILEIARQKGAKIASFVNMPGSSITRLSDYKFMAGAGPEICVMSTKIFVSQIAFGYLLAKAKIGKLSGAVVNLENTAKEIKKYLSAQSNLQKIKKLARILSSKKDIFLIAKGQNLAIAKEGMIKIIEGSYLHAHALPAGDLKHYAITLIEKGVPVIALLSNDEVKKDILSSCAEVKARGAFLIGISPFENPLFDFHLPTPDIKETSALINIIPLQLLAYFLALVLKRNIDKPRNIAKSVTVK